MLKLQFLCIATVFLLVKGNPSIEPNKEGSPQKAVAITQNYIWNWMLKPSIEDMAGAYIGHTGSTTSTCQADSIEYLLYLYKILTTGKTDDTPFWVAQLIDNSGKPPNGILEGNLKWFGSFKECLKVKVLKPNATEVRFTGQYCTAYVNFHMINLTTYTLSEFGISDGFVKNFAVTLGVCWPSTCTAQEIAQQFNLILHSTKLLSQSSVDIKQNDCIVDTPEEYDGPAIAAIIIFSIFGLLLTVGTVYDLSKTDDRQFGVAQRLLLAFSVYQNGKKILNTKQDKESIGCIHGLRFFSITWVILGHTYVNGLLEGPFNNLAAVKDVTRNVVFDVVLNATFSVDTFLVVSGFLVTYMFLKEMKRTSGKFGLRQLWKFYFHRYWRLTPAYMMAILFVAGVYTHISSGPLWRIDTQFEQDNCRKYWWRNILYIQNLFPIEEMCHDVSWYLGIDMQFYVISLVILYPLYHIKKLGLSLIGLFFAATTITAGLIIHMNDLPSVLYANVGEIYEESGEQLKYMDMVYIMPWCRLGPYLVGMLCGYIVDNTDRTTTWSMRFTVIGWSLATSVALSLVFGNYYYYTGDWVMSNGLSSVYGALSRSVWGVSVAWVIYACITGHGGWINKLLSLKALIPASRLTYCAYLIHIYILVTFYSSQKASLNFNHFVMILVFFGTLSITMVLAFVSSLAFEAPMMEMERMFRPPAANKRAEDSASTPQPSTGSHDSRYDISQKTLIPDDIDSQSESS